MGLNLFQNLSSKSEGKSGSFECKQPKGGKSYATSFLGTLRKSYRRFHKGQREIGLFSLECLMLVMNHLVNVTGAEEYLLRLDLLNF